MIHSMTGFGKATAHLDTKTVKIEIRSLNSKQADVNMKVPPVFRSQEIEIRKKVIKALQRGKIDVNMLCDYHPDHAPNSINKTLFNAYVKDLNDLADEHSLSKESIITSVMRIPNVLAAQDEDITEIEWSKIGAAIDEAIDGLMAFRKKEGAELKIDLDTHSDFILAQSKMIESLLPDRIAKVKARLRTAMESNAEKGRMNTNRLEEEFIFYIEKLDLNEEVVRLAAHIENFKNTLNETASSNGRKLGFITQEMGREINTIGAKANYAPIQSVVVDMKEALDKIKEQLFNIL